MNEDGKLKGMVRGFMRVPFLLLIIPAGILVPTFLFDARAGSIMVLAEAAVFLLWLAFVLASRRNLYDAMVDYGTNFSLTQKRMVDELDLPYLIMDENGKILWMNKRFCEISGKTKGYHKSINGVIPSVTKECLLKAEGDITQDIELNERRYRAHITRVYMLGGEETVYVSNPDEYEKLSGEYLNTLCLFDETELVGYKQKIEDDRLVSALVYVDNYDELMQSTEEIKQSMLTALVARRVVKYFSSADAIVKNIDKDKFYVVFKHKFLKQLAEDKFSIIEDIKNIKIGNEIAVTLSIGIGVNRVSYTQNYEYARMAMDLALGRGGDQVVVKDFDKISYYGGATQQVEKHTRVKARVKAHAIKELVQTHENVFIMGHSISDIDCLGAAIGMFCAARELGKKAHIVINKPSVTLKPFMDLFTTEKGYDADLFLNSEQAESAIGPQTLLVVVDTNRPSYTECPALVSAAKTVVVIDHHRQGKEVVDKAVLSYIESYASSTCEMVAEVLQYIAEGIKIESWEADTIYAGILIDTNNFMTKTGVRTFEAAAYLKRSGAEVTRVRKLLRNDMTAYKVRADAVRSSEVYKGAFAIAICPSDNVPSPTTIGAQVANELLNIIGIKASFVLTQYQGKVFISSRSIDEINVQIIMERLGGGGHLNVAGCQIPDVSVEEARQMLIQRIDELIEEGQIQ